MQDSADSDQEHKDTGDIQGFYRWIFASTSQGILYGAVSSYTGLADLCFLVVVPPLQPQTRNPNSRISSLHMASLSASLGNEAAGPLLDHI